MAEKWPVHTKMNVLCGKHLNLNEQMLMLLFRPTKHWCQCDGFFFFYRKFFQISLPSHGGKNCQTNKDFWLHDQKTMAWWDLEADYLSKRY